MVLWGGLRPIAVQAVIDAAALLSLASIAGSKHKPPPTEAAAAAGTTLTTSWRAIHLSVTVRMVVTVAFVIVLSGGNLTNRWTIVFPMIPFVFLQTLRIWMLSRRRLRSVFTTTNGTTAATLSTSATATATASSISSTPFTITPVRKNRAAGVCQWMIGGLSWLLLVSAAALSIMFPAVELPPVPESSNLYPVGVVDLFLPKVEFIAAAGSEGNDAGDAAGSFDPRLYRNNHHFGIRILYPTTTIGAGGSSGWIPYLRPSLAKDFCEVNMEHGAPPPLRTFDWIIHHWRIARLPARRHAQPLGFPFDNNVDADDTDTTNSSLPVVFYSPGLGGTSEIYSYQTLSLAAHGFVVVVLEHGDGSMAVMPRKDGSAFRRTDPVFQDYTDGNLDRYVQGRRTMTEYRSEELLAATKYMVGVNEQNSPELESAGLSFVGKLDMTDIHYMGHSFGGATGLHAARKAIATTTTTTEKTGQQELPRPRSIIAHDPVLDWMPDITRGSLFDRYRLKDSNTNYTRWTTALTSDDDNDNEYSDATQESSASSPLSSSVHDLDLLILFSHQWDDTDWSGIDVLQDMQHRGMLGRDASLLSRVEVVDSAHHMEFSDICMLTPTWLARAVGMTGEKSPLDTAKDIHTRTLNFLMEVRGRE